MVRYRFKGTRRAAVREQKCLRRVKEAFISMRQGQIKDWENLLHYVLVRSEPCSASSSSLRRARSLDM